MYNDDVPQNVTLTQVGTIDRGDHFSAMALLIVTDFRVINTLCAFECMCVISDKIQNHMR